MDTEIEPWWCNCGTVPRRHERAKHPDCEYHDHHCDECHKREFCTVAACEQSFKERS